MENTTTKRSKFPVIDCDIHKSIHPADCPLTSPKSGRRITRLSDSAVASVVTIRARFSMLHGGMHGPPQDSLRGQI